MENNYFIQEAQLIDELKSHLINKKVITKTLRTGSISNITGKLFNHIILWVDFPEEQKKYSADVALNSNYISFETEDLLSLYNRYNQSHLQLTSQYEKEKLEEEKAQRLRVQEDEMNKKAEEKYQRAKERAIKKFEEHTYGIYREPLNKSEEFYYSLGWLAKHIGTVSATLPDYLEAAFVRYFGPTAPHRLVDSKRKTVNGNPMQYSWSFKATLHSAGEPPIILSEHLNLRQTEVSDTSLIWELVDTYNFKFGRKQDIASIMSTIPFTYKDAFKAGFNT